MYTRSLLILFGLLMIGGVAHAQPTTPDSPTVVYFTPVDTTTQLPVSLDAMEAALNLHFLHTWKAVLEFDAESAIEVLLIDPAALPDVDPDWTTAAYQRGVVIGGFHILGAEMAALVGNPCIERKGFADTTPNYVLVHMQITWVDSDAADRLDPRPFERCAFGQPLPTLTGGRVSSSRQSADTLDSAALFEQFRAVLGSYLGESG